MSASIPLSDDAIEAIAAAVAPLIAARLEPAAPRGWLDVDQAAEYLACPRSRIYALRSAERIPYHRDGSRLLFRADELDAWVAAGGARRP